MPVATPAAQYRLVPMPTMDNYLPSPRMHCALAYVSRKSHLHLDRLPLLELTMSEELNPNTLVVRREGVTEVQ